MGAKRQDINWTEIQALYMSDRLSLREIGSRYGVSGVAVLKRAKKESWPKDLTHKVAAGVKDAIVNSQLTNRPVNQRKRREAANQQAEVVKAAIEEGKQVVLRHMSAGKLLADNANRLAAIIRAKIETMEADPANADNGELFTLARSLEAIVRATTNTVAIERQSRGLDDQPADPNAPPSISITYYRSDLTLQKIDQGP
jgi:hypothetical protein